MNALAYYILWRVWEHICADKPYGSGANWKDALDLVSEKRNCAACSLSDSEYNSINEICKWNHEHLEA